MPEARSVRVFISYAHLDDALRERLRAHLSPLEREGLVQTWDDREILAGDEWADEIDERLNQADVILLLVTADFIKSEYCYGKELERALERNADKADRAIVIPVILRKCDWESTKLSRLQALPRGAHPISDWKTEDDYYTAVAKGLRSRIRKVIDPASGWVGWVGQRLRDPQWWQQPAVWVALLGIVLSSVAGGWWWWQAAARADREVAQAVKALRSGRYADAAGQLEPVCQRLVSRQACFALAKARLGVQLETPATLKLEPFAAQTEALKATAPDDPDLLLFSAELALGENRPELHAKALADIDLAIRLAGDQFPEAYFYLANLHMVAGRYAEALPLLDKAIGPRKTTRDPAPEHYLNMRAYARARTNDLAGARQDYEQSADRGSIISRIELAELLWRASEFDRAADQLATANAALASPEAATSGRNALPWELEIAPGKTVPVKQGFEKQCYARWMWRAGLALAERPDAAAGAGWRDCGPEATQIAAAVAASLGRAAAGGMNEAGTQRAVEFAKQHRLVAAGQGGG